MFGFATVKHFCDSRGKPVRNRGRLFDILINMLTDRRMPLQPATICNHGLHGLAKCSKRPSVFHKCILRNTRDWFTHLNSLFEINYIYLYRNPVRQIIFIYMYISPYIFPLVCIYWGGLLLHIITSCYELFKILFLL